MLKDALQVLAKNIVDDLMLEIEKDLSTRLPLLLRKSFDPAMVDGVVGDCLASALIPVEAAPIPEPANDGFGLPDSAAVENEFKPLPEGDVALAILKKLNNKNFNQVVFELVVDPTSQNNLKKFFNLSDPIVKAFNDLALYDRALLAMVIGSVVDMSEGAINELVDIPLTQDEVFQIFNNSGFVYTKEDWMVVDGLKALNKFVKEVVKCRRAADNAQKRLANLKIKKPVVAPKPEVVKVLEDTPEDTTKDFFTPVIATANRVKLGVVGLIPSNCKIIQRLFGDTFNLTLVLTEEGISRVKSASDSCQVVVAMKTWISHKHAENIEKDKLILLGGGMTTLKSKLSELAKQYYPEHVV